MSIDSFHSSNPFRFDYWQINSRIPAVLGGIGLFAVLVFAAWQLMPQFTGNDWHYAFRPAAQQFLAGKDPYAVEQFMLPPWTLILFAPLSVLPEDLAIAVLRILGLGVYAYTGYRLQAKPLGLLFLLLSPQILHCLINGNVDWLVMLGFVLPPQIGLFFVVIKPQLGLAIALFWLWEAYREKRLLRTFMPCGLALLVSFLLHGLWPLNATNVPPAYETSLWPMSIPFGLVLLYHAVRSRNQRIALAISPLFSSHVMFHSWASFLLALAPNTIELGLAVAGSWIIVLLTVMGLG